MGGVKETFGNSAGVCMRGPPINPPPLANSEVKKGNIRGYSCPGKEVEEAEGYERWLTKKTENIRGDCRQQ
jgi:hypothetical protein